MNATDTIPNSLTPPCRGSSSFNKYELYGAYHYNGTFGTPHWNRFDLRLAARYLTAVKMLDPLPGQTILDAGSGEGVAALLCAQRGAIVTAIELDSEARRLGEAIALREGFSPQQLRFEQDDLCALSLPNDSIDKVVSLEVIEHMHDCAGYLSELRRVLKTGGRIVISTPLKRSDGVLQDRYHIEEFDHESLGATMATAFRDVEVFSCWRDGLNERYESNRPFVCAAKLRRCLTRFNAYHGNNPFVGPVAPDAGCGVILAVATK